MNCLDYDNEFLKLFKNTLKVALDNHVRSTKKLHTLHGGFAHHVLKISDSKNIRISALGDVTNDNRFANKEELIKGAFYEKNVDLVISFKKDSTSHSADHLCALGFKMIMSNFKQNVNNYFESMLGETANIRSSGSVYCQVILFPKQLPYFYSGKERCIKKFERIDDSVFDKYRKLMNAPDSHCHRPNAMLICCFENERSDEIIVAKNFDEYKRRSLEYIDFFSFSKDRSLEDDSKLLFINRPSCFMSYLLQRVSM